MIRANIEAEVNPIVGTEQQSEDLVRYMLREFDEDPSRIWESNMFGKSLYELVGESIHTKLAHMPEASRVKLSETLERIINEGSGGLICILL
jgi:stage IV sporulation protein A